MIVGAGRSPAISAMREHVWRLTTMFQPLADPHGVTRAQLMLWQSLREPGPLAEGELDSLAEVLVIALECEGFLLTEISHGDVQQSRSCDMRALIRMALPLRLN